MTAAARRAYAQARTRARRGSILPPDAVTGLAAVEAVSSIPGWRDPGVADDGSAVVALVYARLVDDYALVIRTYPEAREALTALLRLHEIENVKLLWRAAVGGLPSSRWRPAWRPLGRLESVGADALPPRFAAADLAAALVRTPYGRIADRVLRAHGGDIAAAEVAFDRFASEAVASARARLPASERSARELLRLVLARRDAAIFQRATTTLGIAPDAAVSMTVLGRTPSRRPTDASRRVLCGRVFAQEPFSLAVPIALVLRREDERRRLLTLAELRARLASPADVRRALEAALVTG